MNLLVVTNLYPPQELGGYGRSIADFVWGLRERGHSIQVLSSDAPHLGRSSERGPSGEAVDRRLQLKGSYEGGVRPLQDPQRRRAIDQANTALIRGGSTASTGMEFCWAISTCWAPSCCLRFLRRPASCSITWVLCTPLPAQCLAREAIATGWWQRQEPCALRSWTPGFPHQQRAWSTPACAANYSEQDRGGHANPPYARWQPATPTEGVLRRADDEQQGGTYAD